MPAQTPRPGNRSGTGGTLPPEETRFKPGISGNLAGRPKGDALIRRCLRKSFEENESQAALARRWGSTKHVQDMVELLARLEGELTKEAGEATRGIEVLILNNGGATPLDPEVFRDAARRKALEARASGPSSEDGAVQESL